MSNKSEGSAFVLGLFAGLIVGIIVVGTICTANWETLAIEHNAAQYNHITGDFEWLDEVQYE